ncbi:MAG: anaerobic glycerol-3-phosphate dehydrogenase subunit GlpB [Candidatus Thorarchaeota archaeon]
MDLDVEVLVIGGGMAGLVAGTIAAENGLNTLVLRKGQGATAYSSGAVDVIGYLPATLIPFSAPIEGLQLITEIHPFHPYGMFAFQETQTDNILTRVIESVRSPIEWLQGQLKDSIAPLYGGFETNVHPITVLGTTKPTCLVQKTMWNGGLMEADDSVLLFAGFHGHPDFHPSVASKAFLERQMQRSEPPHKVGHCIVDITPHGKQYNVSSIELARHFDHDASITELVDSLKKHIDQVGATHVALPPVLGVESSVKNAKKMQDELGAIVFELLAFPPSVPGLRLQKALDQMYLEAGGRLLIGHEVVSGSIEERQVMRVKARSPRRSLEVTPKAVVLATGKFIGGGIEGDQNGFRETVFGLMAVTGEFYSAAETLPLRQTNTLALSPRGQPFLGAGLSVDAAFRPIDQEGEYAAENLFCAGSILAGHNFPSEKSGLGVSLSTGYAVGHYATGIVKEGG